VSIYQTAIKFMNMKRILIALLVIASALFGECSKGEFNDSIIGKWEVISLYDGHAYDNKTENTYVLKFGEDNQVSIRLDINSCGSGYDTKCDECISFAGFACTKACCDSEFAVKLIEVIGEATKYDIKSDILTLKNVGEVKLKRISD